MADQVSDSVVINATADQVMAVILDLEAYPSWSDDIKAVEVLSVDEHGRPIEAHFDVDARVAQVDYTLRYDHSRADGVSWTLSQGEVLRQLDGEYDLSEGPDGTVVVYTLAADIAIPVPGFLKKRATRTILDTGLRGLKRRVEALY
jgi:ribosome-associated toxin RatA of RatAB toxin-antitoxin module